jgi:Phosphotransferase enzyme family
LRLDGECEWLIINNVLPADLVTRNRLLAETALRPWTPVFIHGDLQVDHVFVDGDQVTGIVDWSEGARATRSSTSPSSRSGTRSTLATSSPTMAPTLTATSSAHCRRCDALLTSAGWPSTATARPRNSPRSPCCDPGREAAQARLLTGAVPELSEGELPADEGGS